MKIVFLLAVCFLCQFSASAQLEDKNAEVGVAAMSLARDDGSGKAGETTDVFLNTDTPIHCFIQLDSTVSATVKLVLVAVKAAGLPAETKSIAVSYTTNGNQNQVNFNASPEKSWAAGSYRADVYVNGKLAKSHRFTIENSVKQTEAKKPSAPKSVASRKTAKKPRKN